MIEKPREFEEPRIGQQFSVCQRGWLSGRWRPSPCLLTGLLVGGTIAIASAMIGNLPSGHQFNDPILLALSIGTLLRSLIYFNWTNFFMTLTLPLVAGALSWILLRQIAGSTGRQLQSQNADMAAKSAVLVSVIPVLFAEVDAIQVLLWYGISTWLAMIIASMLARSLTRIG